MRVICTACEYQMHSHCSKSLTAYNEFCECGCAESEQAYADTGERNAELWRTANAVIEIDNKMRLAGELGIGHDLNKAFDEALGELKTALNAK